MQNSKSQFKIQKFRADDLKSLYMPLQDSHKGQNGKLVVIGGSKLFHAASLWSLKVASRIVDMVFYSSVPENTQIVQKAKEEFRDGIVVPRAKLDSYIEESDCVLIGPGLPRKEGEEEGDEDTKQLTETLIKAHSSKKWVIDGGSLQVMEPSLLKLLGGNVIITPHKQEFELLQFKNQNAKFKITIQNSKVEEQTQLFAKEFNCVVLLKGQSDLVCSPTDCVEVNGGNPGMTKGGTGDVLSGLVAALACKNDLFLAAVSGSLINKKAGESLFKKVGPYFNASDLADEIPRVMNQILK